MANNRSLRVLARYLIDAADRARHQPHPEGRTVRLSFTPDEAEVLGATLDTALTGPGDIETRKLRAADAVRQMVEEFGADGVLEIYADVTGGAVMTPAAYRAVRP